MSRVGKPPIDIPAGVEVSIGDGVVRVKGPKGKLEQVILPGIKVEKEDNQIQVERSGNSPREKSFHGLMRTLIYNMVKGVTEGFEKVLDIQGVGYRAKISGKNLELQLGYSKPCSIVPPAGIEFEVPAPNRVIVRGHDKQLVGQVAADIRRLREPDSYKGKGVRYLGEQVRRKAGKTVK